MYLSRKILIISGAAAVLLSGAAIPAVALAGRSPVTYYACVTTRTGALKIVSRTARCAAGQHKISWNNIGPAGPRGLQGPPGKPGKQGPPGVVTGYIDTAGPVALNTSSTTVATLDLPQGKFELSADVAINSTPSPDFLECILRDSTGVTLDDQYTTTALVPASGDAAYGELTLLGDTSVGGTVDVECSDTTSTATADPVTIQAIPLQNIVASTG